MLRPLSPRPPLRQPAPRWDPLPSRAGLAQPRHRPQPGPIYKPTWTETMAFGLAVNAAGTAFRTSNLIHNPYRLNGITWNSAATPTIFLTMHVHVTQGDPDPSSETGLESLLIQSTFNNATDPTIMLSFDTAPITLPGHMVHRYPSRILVHVENPTATDTAVQVLLSITHFRHPEPADYPRAEDTE